MTSEDNLLQLSGIQHFCFCKRQWALIHIEQQWSENQLTVEGNILHERAHNETLHEARGDLLTVRGLRISSDKLRITGQCDIVEFHRDPNGVPIRRHNGTWQPYPVEYKRGKPKEHNADRIQLCAQAMCLEEMLCCDIFEGSLFYGETHRREIVIFSPDLRETVKSILKEMHEMFIRGTTPMVRISKACQACSLKDICVPKLCKNLSAKQYITQHLAEDGAT